MVDIASRVMLGESLKDIGCGTGLHKYPPYCAVKVPIFSFEKLTDANSILGPEMKSTGEVLGLGRTEAEALFKGLTSAGFAVPTVRDKKNAAVLISVEDEDQPDAISLAKHFYDIGIKIYATKDTSAAINSAGIKAETVANVFESDDLYKLLDNGIVDYVVYTGAVKDDTVGDYRILNRKAMNAGIPCLTSLDTAEALVDIISSRYNLFNTELIDINNMD